MKLNKKVLGSLVLALACGAALLPKEANAQGVAETGVGIGFSSGGTTIVPGPYENQLSLISRPTAFQFGTTNDSSETTKAYDQVVDEKQYLSAYEDRDEKTKWSVNAQMSDLKAADGATNLAATLSFNTATVSTFKLVKDEDGMFPKIVSELPPLVDYADTAVQGFKKVNLEAGSTASTAVMTATADALAKGEHGGFAAEVKNVQLLVNGDQETKGKAFSGTVTWSLDDTK